MKIILKIQFIKKNLKTPFEQLINIIQSNLVKIDWNKLSVLQTFELISVYSSHTQFFFKELTKFEFS